MLRKNVAGQFIYLAAVNATTGAALTGATISGRRALDGTFAALGATITEDTGLGFYKVAFTQADTNGNNNGYFFTATNMVPIEITVVTTAADPTDAVRFGLTALPNAVVAAIGGLLTAPTTANVGLADLSRILGTALTETAGQLAGGFKKFFNITTPASTMDALTLVAAATTVTNQLTAAQIATGVWTDTTAGDFTTALSIGKTIVNGVTLGTGLTINAYTGNTVQTGDAYARLGAPAGANVSADVAAINTKTTNLPAAPASTTNITAGTITTVTNLTNAPTAGDLTATMKTSVKTQAVDALATDTYAEPGQGAPAATTTLAVKINYLYKLMRNKLTQTSTTLSVFDDAGSTVDQKATVSDDGTTYTRGEIGTGP